MWFRYLVSFFDLGFAGIFGFFAMKSDREGKIMGSILALSLLASVILMWR